MVYAFNHEEAVRAYIEALATRYAPEEGANRAALDSAYAAAMAQVAARYPDDLDASALWAEARMDLRPWDYWTQEGAVRRGHGCGRGRGTLSPLRPGVGKGGCAIDSLALLSGTRASR